MFVPLHCLNFGIGGDRTEHVLWRLQNGELENLTPKVRVIPPTGSEERGVLGVWSIPVAILPSCQDMKATGLGHQYNSHGEHCGLSTASDVFLIFTTQPYSCLCNYNATVL